MSAISVRLVYILAASHSGSTLLAMILGSHPEVCTVGELKATAIGKTDDYLCSCKRRLRDCPFWTRIRSDMGARGFPLDFSDPRMDYPSVAGRYAQWLLKPLHRGRWAEGMRDAALLMSPSWRNCQKEIRSRNVALMECLCSRTGKRIIVDSSKIGLRLKYLLRIAGFDVRVIWLIRDGRAVALTYMNPAQFADAEDPALRGAGDEPERLSERLPMALAAREWKRSNEEAECLLRNLSPEKWTQVRYEELCQSPQTVLHGLAGFIGVDPHQMKLNFRSDEKHVIGNGMRLDDHADIRLDERWRRMLSADQLETFNFIAGRLNQRLGYHD